MKLWEKKLEDDSLLIGVKGDGSHTHIGSGFVSIRDEQTGKGLHFNTPVNDLFVRGHGPGCPCPACRIAFH